MFRSVASLIGLVVLPVLVLGAGEPGEKSIREGDLESRVDALASIQPGLGVVMHEIGYRFAALYWAAKGGNWGLAQYQLKELGEAQEVAEVTRPRRREMLKAFEGSYLAPLRKAIEAQDGDAFGKRFLQAQQGCNACHTALGYGFIQVHVPESPVPGILDYSLKSEPRN
ncbi:hypothetical protein [Pseudomonas zhanjiangensis]|uniref:Cytochrome c domain-containing protein n=1 Tax=Pseudomonas zhanjiangensis TaxID=3239015 RepID=A0ABV3YTB3_9PSED